MKNLKPALNGALFVVLLTLATGCADAPDENQIVDLEPVQDSAESPAAQEEATESAEEEAPSAVEEEFGSEYTYADGLTVRLAGVERRVSGEWDMPESTPYVYFDVQFDNTTGAPVDLTYLSVYCQVGEEGRTAEDVYTDQTGTGFTSAVMDGRTATAGFGCALPEEESYLQVELTLSDWEEADDYVRETVYFVGDVA
ncbi:hypothetical protein Q8791_00935 [Nocardiopsis sp. CT-R113]|uniref:DUF4352 domain-containing protein n=1 Tax=Nocardiopsis codii TaxID=3065942 RepID=A0ABU7K0V0_9ACTN|nr:hypothetical protein [Nocardiopsis sp. CT-R113]MEE2035785.1 hypothetical protein [Nocardiopsis sp. CT-R113]